MSYDTLSVTLFDNCTTSYAQQTRQLTQIDGSSTNPGHFIQSDSPSMDKGWIGSRADKDSTRGGGR